MLGTKASGPRNLAQQQSLACQVVKWKVHDATSGRAEADEMSPLVKLAAMLSHRSNLCLPSGIQKHLIGSSIYFSHGCAQA